MTAALEPDGPRCSALSAEDREPLAGSAPQADFWVVVEHPAGWADAGLARAEAGVRVLMARGRRDTPAAGSPAGYRIWVAQGAAGVAGLRVGVVDDPGVVADWDLRDHAALAGFGVPDPDPLLLICANGRRDRCCGHFGGRLADRLWAADPLADRILTCTHLGGHRFAPTAMVLPWGVMHGRLDDAAAAALLPAALSGWTPTASLRGHSLLPEPAQVAEVAARAQFRYDGLAPLRVAIEGDPASGRLDGHVDPPEGHGSPAVHVPLTRTSRSRILSCGKPSEPGARWQVAGS